MKKTIEKIAGEDSAKHVFQFFKPFRQDQKRQIKVYNQIKENAEGDFDFYMLSLFAGIIITLGILIDSTAVVIGGMLIAPLVWPIMAMAIGISMGRSHLLQKSLITLLKSVLIILVVAIVAGFVVPELTLVNSEYLERTSPTLFELIIGLAAGFVGAFIIAYPRLGSAIAGVVIAAAIVPPIATMGISMAKGNLNDVAGAALLFLSNLVAITFASVILFLISNFSSKSQQAEEKRASGFRWTLLLLVVIIVPLVFITQQTAVEVKTRKIVNDVVQSSLENAAISELKTQEKDDVLTINTTIRYKDTITEDQVHAIESILSKRLKKLIVLRVQIIPVIEAGGNMFTSFQTPGLIDEPIDNTKEEPISTSEETEGDQDVKEESNFIECPIVVNNRKIPRMYPKEIGCPVCLKIISCWDGREFPAQTFNEETGLCEDIEYLSGRPCELFDDEEEEIEKSEEDESNIVDELKNELE